MPIIIAQYDIIKFPICYVTDILHVKPVAMAT